jgi:hypothetical protein
MKKPKIILLLLPFLGSVLFVLLYFISTLFYPGGSRVDKNSAGFSWTNNYWCNLLSENAINGQPNSARTIAMTGMFVICLALSFFWLVSSTYMTISKRLKLVIQISGSFAMIVVSLLFTSFNHDAVINIASLLGIIATTGTLIGLYKSKWLGLFYFGLLNILLVGLNNYVYYTNGLIIYLPVIQKISFAIFLVWICSISLRLYFAKREKTNNRCNLHNAE